MPNDNKKQGKSQYFRKWGWVGLAVFALALVMWIALGYLFFSPVVVDVENVIYEPPPPPESKGQPRVSASSARIYWANIGRGDAVNPGEAGGLNIFPRRINLTIETNGNGNISNIASILKAINRITPATFRNQFRNAVQNWRYSTWANANFSAQFDFRDKTVELTYPTLSHEDQRSQDNARELFCRYIRSGYSAVAFYEPDHRRPEKIIPVRNLATRFQNSSSASEVPFQFDLNDCHLPDILFAFVEGECP